ncbi:MAG: serine/threonine protein kinase [Archangiaceae bacterium]|nr:serine/threonine protein kinase [Archangiaceae bacterium]
MLETLGRYQLLKKLGAGGMAEVFLARAAGPGGFQKQLVLKLILPAFADDPRFVQLFFREAKIAARLNHPHIVQVFDFGSEGDEHFIVMELVDGFSLRELFRRTWGLDRPIPIPLALKLLAQACSGLQYAHAFVHPETHEPMGVVHRDVSPDNILLSRGGAVKLSDFGLAKAVDATHSTTLRGKQGYVAPELMSGDGRGDHRADLFSFGVVMFETLSGRRPFSGSSDLAAMQSTLYDPAVKLRKVRPEASPELEQLVDKLLSKSPDARFPTAAAALTAIERLLAAHSPVRPTDLARYFSAAG